MAFSPQVSLHGFTHLLWIQALSLEQSLFITHSGLQPEYGSPKYSFIHEHWPLLQLAFGPQGDGLHGSVSTVSGTEIYLYYT